MADHGILLIIPQTGDLLSSKDVGDFDRQDHGRKEKRSHPEDLQVVQWRQHVAVDRITRRLEFWNKRREP